MKFGLFLATDFPPGTNVSEQIPKLIEQVQLAREVGVDSIWVLQHYLGNMPTLQPLLILSRLAAEAGNMHVGTNILVLPLHHPVEVAEQYATLDHITGGRTIAGLGMGYRENEFESFGIPMEDRVGRYSESVDILRGLWTGNPFSYEGKHFRIREQTISLPPVQPGGPPIWVGAGVHKAGARRAAALGDAWIIAPHVKFDGLKRILGIYRAELTALGKSLDREYVVRREICLHEDRSVARREGELARARQSQAYAQFNAPDSTELYSHLHRDDFSERMQDLADDAYIFDTPEACVAHLKALEAMGITQVTIRTQWYDYPHEGAMRTLRMFGEQVLPHFRTSASS